jgi:hypothetical protein
MPPVNGSPKDNPLVSLLGCYGPSASSDASVDENVMRVVARHGVEAIVTPPTRISSICANLLGDHPRSVILTGTAGDGKTYHIRRFLFDHAGFPESSWPGGGILNVTLPSGRDLRVIRDLSQLKDSDKAMEIGPFTRSLLGEDDGMLYLAAANDGQLLKFWRDSAAATHTGSVEHTRYEQVLRTLTVMLQHNREVDPEGILKVAVPNLSRSATEQTLEDIFDGVLRHPEWETGCDTCPAGPLGTRSCPIRRNRQVLLDVAGQTTFRNRLKQAIHLAAMNDQHVPVRQMFMLCVNILLGDVKKRDRPLLSCAEARKRKETDNASSNPFNNAVGLNLRDEKRRAITVFAMLETFGIGYETTNAVDALLMAESDRQVGAQLEATDPHYGRVIFGTILDAYTRGESMADKFNAALEAQRRRLFFLLRSEKSGPDPWQLTVFHHAGHYLELCSLMRPEIDDAKRQAAAESALRQIVKGLNRTLTGMMTDDNERLWLARSIGRAEGTIGRFTMLSAVRRKAAGETFRVLIMPDEITRRPQVAIAYRVPHMAQAVSTPLDLRPLLFEYLMRVADGSLPSSFSRQCQQEVRHFALAASAFVEGHMVDESDRPIQILAVGNDGAIAAREIGV